VWRFSKEEQYRGFHLDENMDFIGTVEFGRIPTPFSMVCEWFFSKIAFGHFHSLSQLEKVNIN